jgi:hypothetical protein
MFRYGLPLIKEGAHADVRLSERTNLDKGVLKSLRRDLKKTPVPYGSHHVTLDDGSFAVLKDVSNKGRKRHVVATVLGSDMSPPGTNVTRAFRSTSKGKEVYIDKSEGPNMEQESGRQTLSTPNKHSGKFGATRRERLRDSLNRRQEKGSFSHKKLPGGHSSSEEYSFSSSSVR